MQLLINIMLYYNVTILGQSGFTKLLSFTRKDFHQTAFSAIQIKIFPSKKYG